MLEPQPAGARMTGQAVASRKRTAQRRQRKITPDQVRGVPKLVVASRAKIKAAKRAGATKRQKNFRYEVARHTELPHVVKFSGGRSSGLLLFILLESGLLKAERGDVVVFNNTSAEHPKTYQFVARCKRIVEERYGIPFFLIEFQTYEDARGGEWTRLPSYRLAKPSPWSESNPDGYRWKGETFEELLSWTGYVPNQFQRICTQHLKLRTTRAFLRDWFSCKEGIARLGHYGSSSRIDDEILYARHKKNRGDVPRDILLSKKAYMRSRPISRPEQRFVDFSSAVRPIENDHLRGKRFGESTRFGDGGIEYTAFVGLRSDEARRVFKVRMRNRRKAGGPESDGYEGEHVYTPLADMKIERDDVDKFWSKQSWNLGLGSDSSLSNCVYCFLKGLKNLQKVHAAMNTNGKSGLADTPCDIEWWTRIEQDYGRDMKAEKREIKGTVVDDFIGFFGASSGFSYEMLSSDHKKGNDLSRFSSDVLPCDCTD